MENAEQILVVILSSALAVFLVVGIIFFIIAIKVIKTLQRVSNKAENLAERAEAVSELVQKAATPMVIGRALTRITSLFFGRKSKR